MGNKKAISPQHRRPRKGTLWRAAIAMLVLVAFGCGQGNEDTVQVVGSAPRKHRDRTTRS